jgi:HAD superfamily hydrolase (TIGR01490 family)
MKFIIFDLDDTLLCGDCEREWINFLFLKGLIKDPKSKLDQFDKIYRKGALDFEEYSNFIQSPIIGLTKAKVDNYVYEFIQKNIDNLTDKLTNELLNEADSADKVLIASGSHDYLVDGFTKFFKIDSGIGTSAELKNNVFTGHLLGEPTFSNGKVKAVEKWCLDNGLKVNQSIFYSDSINDLPMFEACGVPIAVNPDNKLRKIAEERSFKVINR